MATGASFPPSFDAPLLPSTLRPTLGLEGALLSPEGLPRRPGLQQAQVALVPDLWGLHLALPHRHDNLSTRDTPSGGDSWLPAGTRAAAPALAGLTLALGVPGGSLSSETVSGKMTSSMDTMGSSTGSWGAVRRRRTSQDGAGQDGDSQDGTGQDGDSQDMEPARIEDSQDGGTTGQKTSQDRGQARREETGQERGQPGQ